jgi:hypothetical protein
VLLSLWVLAASVALGGGGLAALSQRPARRRRGLALTVAAVGLLLVLLGSDLLAVAWLAVAGAAVLLPGLRRQSAAVVAGPARLAALAVPAALVFAALYRVVLQVSWAALPAGEPEPQTALGGGRLLTADGVVLVGISLLLTAVLTVALRPPRGGAADPQAAPDAAPDASPGVPPSAPAREEGRP